MCRNTLLLHWFQVEVAVPLPWSWSNCYSTTSYSVVVVLVSYGLLWSNFNTTSLKFYTTTQLFLHITTGVKECFEFQQIHRVTSGDAYTPDKCSCKCWDWFNACIKHYHCTMSRYDRWNSERSWTVHKGTTLIYSGVTMWVLHPAVKVPYRRLHHIVTYSV